mmetsp:Transcript_17324/g.33974  ORF Transcript_17324/g.33974 Transcript_17324/m.33974 type:complete len:194 (-) Transcript_17324:5-586(-)
MCSYDKCLNPTDSHKYHKISNTTSAGGQDWSPHVGKVFCDPCYERFSRRGTLERSLYRLEASEKMCSYDKCLNPTGSRYYYKISNTTSFGGKDWSHLVGNVVCHTCYSRFRSKGVIITFKLSPSNQGTLERSLYRLEASEKMCSYDKCLNPTDSHKYHKISNTTSAGGQDWSPHVGKVFCSPCYQWFLRQSVQ